MGRSLHAAATLVAALALVAAGCGDGDGEETTTAVSPTLDWAEGFCTAITTWTSSLENVADQFTDLSNFSRAGLEEAADDVRTATDDLVQDLRDLGEPETESGEAIKDSIDELTTTLEDELRSIEDAVRDVSGITGIPRAAASITSSLAAMSSVFLSTQRTIEDADVQGELRQALDDAPACADLPGR